MQIRRHHSQDIRFPTSKESHGSDAMNIAPDYSCAYIEFEINGGQSGHGLTFTIGRGTELCVAAIDMIAPAFYGIDLDDLENDPGLIIRLITEDSQLRWLGPEKGVVHLATAAVVNALWDALAKRAGLPLWEYVSSLPPEQIVRAIDFRHISDYLNPSETLERLAANMPTRHERIRELKADGYPAYTTSAGWIGYDDDTFRSKLLAAYEDGWRRFKIKVGRNIDEDRKRCRIFRETLGDAVMLSVDANQIWGVAEAIEWTGSLAEFDIWWMEEPTSPDDILGHRSIAEKVAPIQVATGEHAHNRVMFKQFLQAGAMGICQIDACRLGGVNEVLAVLLMADKAGVPVCPHAGGVGLCEYVQHLSMIDYVCISGSLEGRATEYAEHLHEHFLDPPRMRNGRYLAPDKPGYSAEMRVQSQKHYAYPNGLAWRAHSATQFAV